MSYRAAVDDIVTIQQGLASFWSASQTWAPAESAALLSTARLDWMPSLANSLQRWALPEVLSEGDLILAWANLGSIMESSLRLFLAVYLSDYHNSIEDLRALDALQRRGSEQGLPYLPSDLQFEKIRQLLARRQLFPDSIELIALIQSRRNSIHSFTDREIGTTQELRETVVRYRVFISSLATRLPYPDVAFPWLDLAERIWSSHRLRPQPA